MKTAPALLPKNLKILLDRHNDPEREVRYGTPGVFLYARRDDDRNLMFFRFAKVKKPSEHTSSEQHGVITSMRGLQLPARLLRLIERNQLKVRATPNNPSASAILRCRPLLVLHGQAPTPIQNYGSYPSVSCIRKY